MAGRMVRSIRDVKDVNDLSESATSENDIISDVDGNIYIKHRRGYIKLAKQEDSQKELTSIKSEQTKLKNRVSELETSNTDLISRIEALETPTDAGGE